MIDSKAQNGKSDTKNAPPQREANPMRMETREVKISSTFNKTMGMLRTMVLLSWVTAIVLVVGAGVFAYQSNDQANRRVYVATDLGTLYAFSTKVEDPSQRRIEIDNHIRLFVSNTYAFDEYNYEEHLKKGLDLIGTDGRAILDAYNELDFHNNLRKKNMKVTVDVDSILVNTKSNPYRAVLFARQTFENSSSRSQFRLWAEMTLRNVSRDKNNVHGLKIDNWNIFRKDQLE